MVDEVANAQPASPADDGPAAQLLSRSSIAAAEAETSEPEAATATNDVEATADASPADEEGAGAETDLLGALARAMHDAAAMRRTQILEAVEDRRTTYVQGIRDRGSAEAMDLRADADGDVDGITSWADAEIERIKGERTRRSDARKRELDALLDRHAAQLEWEIESIEEAVAGHRNDLETFFGRLDSESDVTTLARLAQDVPQMPDLEGISADARARAELARSGTVHPARATFAGTGAAATASVSSEAVTEPGDADEIVDEDRLIGVMDPAAHGAPSDFEIEPVATEPAETPEAVEPPALEPVAAERSSSGQLLQAISALRPSTSWLRAGNGSEEKKAE